MLKDLYLKFLGHFSLLNTSQDWKKFVRRVVTIKFCFAAFDRAPQPSYRLECPMSQAVPNVSALKSDRDDHRPHFDLHFLHSSTYHYQTKSE